MTFLQICHRVATRITAMKRQSAVLKANGYSDPNTKVERAYLDGMAKGATETLEFFEKYAGRNMFMNQN